MAGTLSSGNPSIGVVKSATRTTDATPSDVFRRNSHAAQAQGYIRVANFGDLITQPLSAINGFLRGLDITFTFSGGTGAVTPAVWAADSPWNVIQNIQLTDSLGNFIINVDGYALFLLITLGGQVGQGGRQLPTSNPSFARATGNTGVNGGNMTFRLRVPLEFDSTGYCSFADMNASAPPQLRIQLNPAATVYSTPPGTLPTVTVQVDQPYWLVPNNSNSQPVDLGSYAPWIIANGAENPTTGATLSVRNPSVGNYIHTMVGILRNASNARIPAWPATSLSLFVDGYAIRNMELYSQRQDEIWRRFGVALGYDEQSSTPIAVGGTISAIAGGFAGTSDSGSTTSASIGQSNLLGIVAYTFRASVQEEVSSADDHNLLLKTGPATTLQVGGIWGTIASSPAQVTWLTGSLVPQNAAAIPYTHLGS